MRPYDGVVAIVILIIALAGWVWLNSLSKDVQLLMKVADHQNAAISELQQMHSVTEDELPPFHLHEIE